MRIYLRKLHNHASGRTDDLPSQENVFQTECLDLLPIFCPVCEIHLENQKQVVSEHHQLKYSFVGPKGLEQQVTNRHIILGFFDVIFSVAAFS
jgi:hypothetical protein